MIVFLIVLLLFGAKKLPQLARGVGKSMGEFKRARDEFEHEITRSEQEVSHTPAPKAVETPAPTPVVKEEAAPVEASKDA